VAASHRDAVGFLVLLAGPGLPGFDVIQTQARDILKADGKSDKEVDALVALNRLSLGAMMKPWANPRPVLAAAAGGLATPTADKWRPKAPGDPWMRHFLTYDPRPTLALVRCPVLALIGGKDLQVAARPNLDAIRSACPWADCRELPELNHLFQPATTGSPGEYGKIETTFDPAALGAISAWVLAVQPGEPK
jgi:hypothetical protein